MKVAVFFALVAFGLVVLFSIYKLFAPTPDRADDPDSRFGHGNDDCAGGGD